MSKRGKDISYFHRLEQAVRLLATSPDSPRKKVELAFSSFLLPIIPAKPRDSIDHKLCVALALATKFSPLVNGEGMIRSTMRRVRFTTLAEIMNLIFDAYLETRRRLFDQ